MRSLLIVLIFLSRLAPLSFAGELKAPMPSPRHELAEDFGPQEIDVGEYPVEYQKTYREIFIPIFGFRGLKSRIINSPIIEMDARVREAEERLHPALFSDPSVAQPSPDGWKKQVKEIMMKPPCCSACPILTHSQAKELWDFLVYDSLARKTGKNADKWIEHRRNLIAMHSRDALRVSRK